MLDVLYAAARSVRRNWIFSVTVVVLIAVGIGIVSSTFALVDAVILRKLPVADPDRLVNINSVNEEGQAAIPRSIYRGMVQRFGAEAQMFGWTQSVVQVDINGESQMAGVLYVTGAYHTVMGGRPELGRLLTRDETDPSAVISDRFWRRSFGGDPNVLGKTIYVGNLPLIIIGVTRSDYRDVGNFARPDLTIPLDIGMRLENVSTQMAERYGLEITALLAPGVTITQAQAQLNGWWPELLVETVPAGRMLEPWQRGIGSKVLAWPGSHGRNWVSKELIRALLIALGMAAILLFTVCANVGGLMVARGISRERETAIRLALGARYRHIVRQWLAESLLLSALAAPCGMLLAWWGARFGAGFLPYRDMDYGVAINAHVIAVAIGLSLVTTAIAGLLPAFRIRSLNAVEIVKTGNPLASIRFGLRKTLIAAQVATAVLLLVASASFLQTIVALLDANLGFDPHHTFVFMLTGKTPWSNAGPAYFQELQQRVRSLPGVQSAALADSAPMQMSAASPRTVSIPGEAFVTSANSFCVWPGFFQTVGLALVNGRDFNLSDRDAVVLTEDLAHQLFQHESPLGQSISIGSLANTSAKLSNLLVIGIVGNAKLTSPGQQNMRAVFLPCVRDWNPPETRYGMALVVRTTGTISGLETGVRQEIEGMDKQFVYRVATGDELVDGSIRRERILASISSLFGTISLFLALVGIYALIAYIVACRRRELGIRMALGARRFDLVSLLLREIVPVILIGELIGIGIALAAGRVFQSFLFGATRGQARPMIVALFVMTAVGVLATYLPVYRAAKLDPARALHHD
jgi:putative ABC transport system permease protein